MSFSQKISETKGNPINYGISINEILQNMKARSSQ